MSSDTASTNIHPFGKESLLPQIIPSFSREVSIFTNKYMNTSTFLEEISILPRNQNQFITTMSIEDKSSVTTSLDYTNPNYIEQLFQIIQFFIGKYQSIWNEIISNIFDIFIKTCLEISNKLKKRLYFDFQIIYSFFQFFGLRNILAKTFNRISAATQWNICPSNWINKKFLEDYMQNNISFDNIDENQSILQLILKQFMPLG